MNINELAYLVFLVLAPILAVILWMIVYAAWPHRHIRGHMPLIAANLLIIGWLGANWLEVLSPNEAGTLFWAKVTYLFIAFLPPTLLIFAYTYTLEIIPFGEHFSWALYLIPAATTLLTIAAPRLPLMWEAVQFKHHPFFISIHPVYGVWFYVHMGYSYLVNIGAFFVLLYAYFRKRHTPKRYSRLLVSGVFIAIFANFSHILHLLPIEKDYTPIILGIAAVLVVMGTLRQRIFDVRPLAALAVVDNLQDAIFLLDIDEKIVDVNPAATALLHKQRAELLGKRVYRILCGQDAPPECSYAEEPVHDDTILNLDGKIVHIERQCLALRATDGAQVGRVLSLRDITPRKESEALLARQAQHIQALYRSTQTLFKTMEITALPQEILKQGYQLASERCVSVEGCFAEIPDIATAVLLHYPPDEPCPCFLNTEQARRAQRIPLPSTVMKQGRRSILVIPMRWHEQWFGVLAFHLNPNSPLREDEQTILENFALTAASALHNAALLRVTSQHAILDSLTHVYNRRGFFEKAADISFREQQKYAIIMLDMDNLKTINDTYGHQAGDMALQQLTEILRRQIRSQDVLSRYGGDEFILLLPRTSLENARIIAKRLHTAIRAARIQYEGDVLHLSVSMGLAVSSSQETLEASIKRADAALYRAKSGGKNRVVVA